MWISTFSCMRGYVDWILSSRIDKATSCFNVWHLIQKHYNISLGNLKLEHDFEFFTFERRFSAGFSIWSYCIQPTSVTAWNITIWSKGEKGREFVFYQIRHAHFAGQIITIWLKRWNGPRLIFINRQALTFNHNLMKSSIETRIQILIIWKTYIKYDGI